MEFKLNEYKLQLILEQIIYSTNFKPFANFVFIICMYYDIYVYILMTQLLIQFQLVGHSCSHVHIFRIYRYTYTHIYIYIWIPSSSYFELLEQYMEYGIIYSKI